MSKFKNKTLVPYSSLWLGNKEVGRQEQDKAQYKRQWPASRIQGSWGGGEWEVSVSWVQSFSLAT